MTRTDAQQGGGGAASLRSCAVRAAQPQPLPHAWACGCAGRVPRWAHAIDDFGKSDSFLAGDERVYTQYRRKFELLKMLPLRGRKHDSVHPNEVRIQPKLHGVLDQRFRVHLRREGGNTHGFLFPPMVLNGFPAWILEPRSPSVVGPMSAGGAVRFDGASSAIPPPRIHSTGGTAPFKLTATGFIARGTSRGICSTQRPPGEEALSLHPVSAEEFWIRISTQIRSTFQLVYCFCTSKQMYELGKNLRVKKYDE